VKVSATELLPAVTPSMAAAHATNTSAVGGLRGQKNSAYR